MTIFFRTLFVHPIQRVLRIFGLKITRLAHTPTVEDLIFQTFGNAQAVNFIQIGAHDGTQNDPISFFRNRLNWCGILVEPNPRVFIRLTENLAGSPRCKALNFAISEKGGTLPFYLVRDPKQCPGGRFSDQISSFDRDHVEKMLVRFGCSKSQAVQSIEEILVETVTFSGLLDLIPAQNLDLLFIDAEGADFRLLKTFPFERVVPRMLVFEFSHLSSDELGEILPFLTRHGYSFIEVGEDIVAIVWKG